MATSIVFTVAPVVKQAGTYQFSGPAKVPVGLKYLTLAVNLSTADKLAVGNTLSLSVSTSADNSTWTFLCGGDWKSYGPSGLTIKDPDGTTVVNPDPRVIGASAAFVGKFVRLQAITNNAMTVGVTVTATQ